MTDSAQTCCSLSEWGRCQQKPTSSGLCSYHETATQVADFRHDRTYHEKIVKGLLEPSHDILTDVEVVSLCRGRARNDGRRTDLYTIL